MSKSRPARERRLLDLLGKSEKSKIVISIDKVHRKTDDTTQKGKLNRNLAMLDYSFCILNENINV